MVTRQQRQAAGSGDHGRGSEGAWRGAMRCLLRLCVELLPPGMLLLSDSYLAMPELSACISCSAVPKSERRSLLQHADAGTSGG